MCIRDRVSTQSTGEPSRNTMAEVKGTAKIALPYQRKRSEFGRPPPVKQDALGGPWVTAKKVVEESWTMFQDRNATGETMEEIFPDDEHREQTFITRKTCLGHVQCGPTASSTTTNTPRFEQKIGFMSHNEGGWPETVDCTDPEQTARFRKRVEKEEEYVAAVKGMAANIEHTLRQNSAIDIYEEYFSGLQEEHTTDPPAAKNLTAFKDPQNVKRTVTSVSWNPDGGRKFACAYSNLQFQQAPGDMTSQSYVWDVNNPNFPDLTLTPSNPLVSLEYHPRDPSVLMGGTYNGLLVFWDLRSGSQPNKTSQLATSHRDPVYDIAWVQSKYYECMTTSTDGQVLWWDSRKMSEPTDHYLLDTTNKQNAAGVDAVVKSGVQGGTSLAYDVAAGPLKFLVGTEAGYICSCDKKSKQPTDRIQSIYTGHYGPVYSLQRHPQLAAKYFLSIGDWTCKIWMQDVKTPIMSTKYDQCYLTGGCWSPTRAGVFYMTKMNGVFEVWDLLYKQNEPTLSIPIGDAGLQCMRVEKENGKLVAFGSGDGSTALYEISDALSVAAASEKSVIMGMLDRETNREKQLVTLDKERRAKLKKLEVEAATAAKAAEANPDEMSDHMIAELEKEVNEILMASGKTAPRGEGESEGPVEKDE
eukprot:TRINITY_DN2168_c0_g1_i2.p1 TRINITY_DN2168_c0_g1~~TRINITY_DN2168_c0_g1_i2.p1  ORF type:complete len:641 (+),score=177.96 TRINITY_DN2168_c0_g1_i2:77-1999(+)